MKKLLFFHHCGAVGGAGISGLCFLNSVPKDEYEITIYCVSQPDQLVKKYRDSGYTVIDGGRNPVSFYHCVGSQLCAISPAAIRNYFAVGASARIIDQVICQQKPDLVVVNSMTLFWIGKLAKKYGAQTLCFFRETYIHGWFGLRTGIIRSQLSKYFDKIAFISNYELERSKSIKSKKKTIYNMIPKDDYDRFSKEEARALLGLDQDAFYVLYVGGTSVLKGAKVILDAFGNIPDKQIKLLFVGGTPEQMQCSAESGGMKGKLRRLLFGDYNKNCLQSIAKNHLEERVCFFPNQSDISPFYRAADVLACPITGPHQARPLFEGGYAKIPVIITDFENIRDLVDDSNGYLFKNGDYAQLARIILDIKNNYQETQSKVEKNYRNTISRHSPEIYQRQIQELLLWS